VGGLNNLGKDGNMNLFQLRLGCFLYGIFTDFDKTYQALLSKTGGNLDPENLDHRLSLIKWLNTWGCRQFAVKYHEFAPKISENGTLKMRILFRLIKISCGV